MVWAIPFELGAPTLIAAWVLLLPVGVVVDAGLTRTAEDRVIARLVKVRPPLQPASAAGAVGWSAAALYALAGDLSPFRWGAVVPSAFPFGDQRTLIAVLLVVTALAAASWTLVPAFRRIAVVAAITTATILVPFEVYADGVVVLWVALAATAILVATPRHGAGCGCSPGSGSA